VAFSDEGMSGQAVGSVSALLAVGVRGFYRRAID
jgi:hypothetical protein